MINIKNLSKSYGKVKIVEDLSLEIKKGTIFGFLGPNGAGKTTTMKMIVGLSIPKTGTIEIGGKDKSKIKEEIGYMPEDPYFYDHLSALEFMRFMGNLFRKVSSRAIPNPPAGGLRKARDPLAHEILHSAQNDKPIQLLKLVGLEEAVNKKINTFSKGMKQRLGLAQAIVNDPDYLFLDEPLDGLDPIGRKEFKEILLDLKKKGKTIFLNSHVLSDVEEICDQIGIINKGKLIYSGSVKDFRGKKSLEEAFVQKISE